MAFDSSPQKKRKRKHIPQDSMSDNKMNFDFILFCASISNILLCTSISIILLRASISNIILVCDSISIILLWASISIGCQKVLWLNIVRKMIWMTLSLGSIHWMTLSIISMNIIYAQYIYFSSNCEL